MKNKLKIATLLLLIAIICLVMWFSINTPKQQNLYDSTESRIIEHLPQDVLRSWGSWQATLDIKAHKPKFYIYGLMRYEDTLKLEQEFQKYGIEPVFQGCVVSNTSNYDFAYNETVEISKPSAKKMLAKFKEI
jgi:hypothetical protein